MDTYEITIELPNGDWIYWREECRDFHAAAQSGLASAKVRKARLHHIHKTQAMARSADPKQED